MNQPVSTTHPHRYSWPAFVTVMDKLPIEDVRMLREVFGVSLRDFRDAKDDQLLRLFEHFEWLRKRAEDAARFERAIRGICS